MSSKHRGFSVVLHDVQNGTQTKQDVIDLIKSQDPKEVVVAQEPYPDQEPGKYHIHVYYRFNTPRHFKTNLKLWVLWWKAGRVQVDAMHGTMAESARYLMSEWTKKEKDTDPDPYFFPTRKIAVSPQEYADEWLAWFLSSQGPTIDSLRAHARIVESGYFQYRQAGLQAELISCHL